VGEAGSASSEHSLTVRAHQANSHRGIGWEQFTDAAIQVLNEQDRPIVFLLWGRPAQMKKSMLNNPKHPPLLSLRKNKAHEPARHYDRDPDPESLPSLHSTV